jgi:carbonic anhydrase
LPLKRNRLLKLLNLEKSLARKFRVRFTREFVTNHAYRIEDSIREDIALIRASPLIKKTTQIVGLKYDIHTGTLTQVQEIQSEL